ncbi:PEP/pyruvate-binding domain-containing protein [Micromonospora sp. DH15]|nr:PEP/pyruvate-binding domain-containing protein [Micromonospora sp. DH15]
MLKYVYDFFEGDRSRADLLGGKGANLAEMTRLGLPVPPGFTISTAACRAYLAQGAPPAGLFDEVNAHLREVEARLGRWLGDRHDPLLLAVRSGGRFSMPGMMETILDIGLNDATVGGLAAHSGDERFAWDSYRRLIQMFGRTVHGVPAEEFERELAAVRAAAGPGGPGAAALRDLVETYKKVYAHHVGHDFPQSPHEQLYLAIRSVFESWNADRAVLYRRREHIPDDLGTAVNVMAMVFGNLGPDSGTGVAFTRDPATGAPGVYGDYLPDAQGEDVVAGIRNTVGLPELERIDPVSFRRLTEIMRTLERHYRDLCDVEFTIERGKLWMLQTRVGKRTPAAAFVIAAQLVDEGLISADEALGEDPGRDGALLVAVRRMHEANPMLGLRGVRLGLVVPGLFAMQVRAVAEAAAQRLRDGGDPRPEIMVPLVGDVRELTAVRVEAERVLAGVEGAPEIPIGTMIEVPRAALTAGEIAAEARFFSFGTNDLTQTAWAFSRDDVEGAFFGAYLERGIFPVSPFESIDTAGVGRLVRLAVAEGRAARPELTVGVCGEHGGDPDSVEFFAEVGLDYVSCSPYRIPIARLAAGRAAVRPADAPSDSR